MSVSDIDATIKRLYRKLFHLPGSGILLSIYIFEWIILYVALGFRVGFSKSIPPIVMGSIVYLSLIYIVFRIVDVAVDSFKKTVGIAVLSLAPYILSEVLSIKGKILISIAGSSALLFLVHFIFRGGILRSLIWSLSIALSTYLTAISFLTGVSVESIYRFGSSFLAALSPILIFILILELGGRLNGIRTFELVRSFLRSWLFDDFKNLEDAFERYSTKRDVKVRFALINRGGGVNDDIVLIFPEFHFGPFKKVGSADAVHVFDDVLDGLCRVFTFHTLGSHELNMVRRSDVVYIARNLKSFLENSIDASDSSRRFEPIRGPYRIESGSWRGLVLGSGSCYLVFLSNVYGSDDIHLSLNDLNLNGRKLLIADSHNKISRRSIDSSDIEHIKRIIYSSIAKLEKSNPNDADTVLVGYGESRVPGVCIGLCKRLVKVLLFSYNGVKIPLIYIYGNNIEENAYSKITGYIIDNRKYQDTEPVTPDDHSCAATTLGTPYTAVHMCRSLLKAINEALTIAEKDLKPAKIACFEKTYRDRRIMGKYVWKMVKGIEILGPITPRLWVVTLAVSIILNALI